MNNLSSENEAAQFINQLSIEVRCDWRNSYLLDLFNEVNRFCGLRRNKWRAKLEPELHLVEDRLRARISRCSQSVRDSSNSGKCGFTYTLFDE
ncbi:hypothetical protein QJS10_CPA07g00377 [Acorus calamus]|uniref:Uncharacterized protein n=1 Tax=Acorus calamus TaxID=4465 RepID=A0AAV9EHB6_ACOCL|nr:hypothetical protein QJS10_CPA07g00377 [Acorus calamus]